MQSKTEFWILGIIAIVAVIAIVLLLTAKNTGDAIYAGGTMQYDTNDVCQLNIECRGEPVLLGMEGGLNPSDTYRIIALCACPENPDMVYRIPMVQTIQYY